MATVTRERELLRELVALVRGECPSLLNEDSGGDVRLSMAIDDALAAPPAEDVLEREYKKALAIIRDKQQEIDRLKAFIQATPASPQAETKRDCTCLGSCRGAEGLSPRYRCVLASPQAETNQYAREFWLGEHGRPGIPLALMDGPHDDRAGVERAAYLIPALGLGKPSRPFVCVEAIVTPVTPSAEGVDHGAVAQNRSVIEKARRPPQAETTKGDE